MRLIGKEKIDRCKKLHAMSSGSLDRWATVIQGTRFKSPHDLKMTFPRAYDYVPPYCHVFDIMNNRYRLIAHIDFVSQLVNIVEILEHAAYDNWECK